MNFLIIEKNNNVFFLFTLYTVFVLCVHDDCNFFYFPITDEWNYFSFNYVIKKLLFSWICVFYWEIVTAMSSIKLCLTVWRAGFEGDPSHRWLKNFNFNYLNKKKLSDSGVKSRSYIGPQTEQRFNNWTKFDI